MVNNLRVVIAAAGLGSRMQNSTNKQFLILKGKPVLAYSIEFFEQLDIVDKIVVVTRDNEREYCQKEIIQRCDFKKVAAVVPGGQERQDSVWLGLQNLGDDTDLVAVHDGARPLLTLAVFSRLLVEAEVWGAAIPGVVSKDTLKMIDADSFVSQTLERSQVYAVQTPQIFKYSQLIEAYRRGKQEGFRGTDDASFFERYIGRVKMVEGDYNNLKITTPGDLSIAETWLKSGQLNS